MTLERFLNQPRPIEIPNNWNIFARRLIIGLLRFVPIAPANVDIVDNSVNKTKELMKAGYSVWILGTHFSKREGFELIGRPAQFIKEILEKPIVMPISLHQYKHMKWIIDKLCQIFGITIAPVVNTDAIDKKENFDPETGIEFPVGTGVPVYAGFMKDSLDKGGVAGIAPQAGRRETLDLSQTKGRPIEYLLKKKGIKRDAKLAFLFMPMSPWDKVNYKEIKDKYNLGMRYDIRLGPVLTLDQMYQILDHVNERLAVDPVLVEKKKTFKVNLDELVSIILSCAADPEYNKVPHELSLEFIRDYVDNFIDVSIELPELVGYEN